jgi:hypothetical protein
MKFNIEDFYENLWRDFHVWLKSDKNVGTLRADISAFVLLTTMQSPCQTSTVFYCSQLRVGQQYKVALLRFHFSGGDAKASRCYAVRTLPVLF